LPRGGESAPTGDAPTLNAVRASVVLLSVPGAIALRCRYRHLLDPASSRPGAGDVCTEALWSRIIYVETDGDLALIRSPERAGAVFGELHDLEFSTGLRIVTVNAAQGLGDAAR
jgi:hypothetical protein